MLGPYTLTKARESFKFQKLMHYPRVTQGGDSHHCGESKGGEIPLPASPLAPKTSCGWTHKTPPTGELPDTLSAGWSQLECSRRQVERELPHHLAQPLLPKIESQ